MHKKWSIDLDEVARYIEAQTPESKIYLGCDSETFRRNGIWYNEYALAVVIHRIEDGIGRGCRVFGDIQQERNFDVVKSKPSLRLMGEAIKLAEFYNRLEPIIKDRWVALHLDISQKPECASNAVMSQAIGYVRGVTGVTPECKPDAWSASFASDRLRQLLDESSYAH